MTPRAAVVIPTYNRVDFVRRAIVSAKSQTVPVEVVVMDDGSTDGTEAMVRGEFPDAIFETHAGPNGPSFLRNRGSQLATAPVLFPIDDDVEFKSNRTVEQTLAEFDHPRVAAVGIPFINVRVGPDVLQGQPAGDGRLRVIAAYVGASHAVRRDVFLRLGGYRRQLFYMGEEGDFGIRALDAGYVVRLGAADPIHHFESPSRSLYRADFYGRRNDVLFAWHNVPTTLLPGHLLTTTLNGVRFGFGVRRPGRMLKGLASGWMAIPSEARHRRPVRPATYRLFRRLRRDGSVPLDEFESQLPALPPSSEAVAEVSP